MNDDSAASVSPQGQAELLRRAETDLIVRYQSHVVSTRLATVINPDLDVRLLALAQAELHRRRALQAAGVAQGSPQPARERRRVPARVSLDLTGEQPTPEQIRAFLADKDPEKRVKLVDRLLARPSSCYFWRIKLGDLLQISPARQGNGAYRYQDWVHRCLSENTPWDVVVTKLLTALGDPNDLETGGPVNYALDALEPNVQAEQTAQRFLGLRMRCAQCHDHPFDVWTQDDYFGLAAFFAKVQRGGWAPAVMMGRAAVTINPTGKVMHLRTKQPVAAAAARRQGRRGRRQGRPRKALADWMTAPDNPYFARATANWVWAQFFGKGLVDPPDDMSRANPPVHPELLDALARHFVATKYDLRDLIRTIATSEAYGLSSATVPGNERDQRLFSHQMPRPLTAHQMADALAQATDVPNRYPARRRARLAIRVIRSRPSPAPSSTPSAAARGPRAAPRSRRLL